MDEPPTRGSEDPHANSVDPTAAHQSELTISSRRRLWWGALTLLTAFASTYVVPGLSRFQPWSAGEDYVPFWNLVGREWLGRGVALQEQRRDLERFERLAVEAERTRPAEPAPGPTERPSAAPPAAAPKTEESGRFPEYAPHADEAEPVEVPIESLEALDYYYGQLTLTELGVPGAITRASHWGDSVLGGDGLTHAIRRRLQERFGDAGHGFHALSRYNLSYVHRGIRFADREGWRTCQIIFKCEPDGRYGYAGVSTKSSGGGTSRFRTTEQGFGSAVSRFELWHHVGPGGGRFQIKLDAEVARVVDTRADAVGDAVVTLEVPDGAHAFEVRAIGNGVARGYGVVLERDVPGVVWDELSLIGAFTQRLDYQDPEHIAWHVRRRDVDLMVFMFGGNDVQRQTMDLVRTMEPYEQEYTRVLQKFRRGKPQASCLLMSLVDHGERVGQHGVQTRKIVPKLVESQRKVALEQGCAFFDTFEAMGGNGSIGRWYFARPQLANADFAHPTVAGQEVIAILFHRALMQGYAEFRRKRVGEPLPELEVAPEGDVTAAPPEHGTAHDTEAAGDQRE